MVLSALPACGMALLAALRPDASGVRLSNDLAPSPIACSLAGDRGGVIADCTTVIETSDKSKAERAFAFFARGDAYASNNETDRALSDFSAAIALDPQARFYGNRGLMYDAKGDLDHAIADFDQALRLEPANVATLLNRGDAYARRNDDARALADYDRALTVAPTFAPVYLARGVLRLRSGDLALARADIARFRLLWPSDPEGAKAEAAIRDATDKHPR